MVQYPTLDEVLWLHDTLVAVYWWLSWIKNKWQLDSVLTHIQNDELYPDIVNKCTHLFFGIIMFHCFNDGNKRTGIATVWYFLELNKIHIEDFVAKMEDIAIWVAQWIIAKEQLKNIFKSTLASFWYSA